MQRMQRGNDDIVCNMQRGSDADRCRSQAPGRHHVNAAVLICLFVANISVFFFNFNSLFLLQTDRQIDGRTAGRTDRQAGRLAGSLVLTSPGHILCLIISVAQPLVATHAK